MKAFLLYLMSISLAVAAEDSGRFQNMVRLKEAEAALLKLETAEAEETAFEETVFALGEIEVLAGKRAVVSSRIAGRAFSVLVTPDQEIAEGDEVAWIESRQPGDPPPTVMLPSPMAGTVASVRIAPGQPVTPDDVLVEIVNLEVVEAAAQVPQHLAGALATGQPAAGTTFIDGGLVATVGDGGQSYSNKVVLGAVVAKGGGPEPDDIQHL